MYQIQIQLNDQVTINVTGHYSGKSKHELYDDLVDQWFEISNISLVTGSLKDYTEYIEDYVYFESKQYSNPKNFDPITGKRYSHAIYQGFMDYVEELCIKKINGNESN